MHLTFTLTVTVTLTMSIALTMALTLTWNCFVMASEPPSPKSADHSSKPSKLPLGLHLGLPLVRVTDRVRFGMIQLQCVGGSRFRVGPRSSYVCDALPDLLCVHGLAPRRRRSTLDAALQGQRWHERWGWGGSKALRCRSIRVRVRVSKCVCIEFVVKIRDK